MRKNICEIKKCSWIQDMLGFQKVFVNSKNVRELIHICAFEKYSWFQKNVCELKNSQIEDAFVKSKNVHGYKKVLEFESTMCICFLSFSFFLLSFFMKVKNRKRQTGNKNKKGKR